MESNNIFIQEVEQIASPTIDSSFRIKNKKFFLTYSRCSIDIESMKTLTVDYLHRTYKLVQYCLVKEAHSVTTESEPNTHHYHFVFEVQNEIASRDCRKFDIQYNEINYHPNICTVKTKADFERIHWYLHKTLEPEQVNDGIINICCIKHSLNGCYAEAINAPTVEQAFKIICSGDPKQAVISGDRIISNLQHIFKKKSTAIVNRCSTNYEFDDALVPTSIKEWIDQVKAGPTNRQKLLIVKSVSRFGKSTYFRQVFSESMGFCRSRSNLDVLNSDQKVWIFDDCDWEFIPSKKGF